MKGSDTREIEKGVVPKKTGSTTDFLANERTFLAWIRTSIAIVVFGFVVVKFSLFLRQLSIVLNEDFFVGNRGYSSAIGIALIIIGGLMSLLAYFRYRTIDQRLKQGVPFPSFGLSLVMTLAIVVVCFLLILYLLPRV